MTRDISHFTDGENKGMKNVTIRATRSTPTTCHCCIWRHVCELEDEQIKYVGAMVLREITHYLLWKGPREPSKTAESGGATLKGLGNNFRKHGTEPPGFSQHLFPQQYLSLCLSFYPNCIQYKSCIILIKSHSRPGCTVNVFYSPHASLW